MKYIVQRYRVRAEDGAKFVLLRAECADLLTAQARMVALTAEDPSSQHDVVTEPDASIPPYVPPPTAPAPDSLVVADKTLVTTFMGAASGTATAVQRDDVLKAIIRYLRRSGQDA